MFKDARNLDTQRTAASFDKAQERYAATTETWFNGSVGSVDKRLAACDKLIHSARFTVARLPISDAQRYLEAAEDLNSDRRALLALRDDLLNGASNREDVSGPPGWRLARHRREDDDPTGLEGLRRTVSQPGFDPDVDEAQRTQQTHRYIQDAYPDLRPPKGEVFINGDKPYGDNPDFDPDFAPNIVRKRNLASADRRWVTLEAAKFVAANADTLDDSHELATRAHHHAAVKTSTFTPQRSAAVCAAFVGEVTELGQRTAAHRPVRVASAPMADFEDQAMYLL